MVQRDAGVTGVCAGVLAEFHPNVGPEHVCSEFLDDERDEADESKVGDFQQRCQRNEQAVAGRQERGEDGKGDGAGVEEVWGDYWDGPSA